MDATKKRYDGKHRVTRIFLADYQLLKELSQLAGVSMAEALHMALTKELLTPKELSDELGIVPSAQMPTPVFFTPKSMSSDGVSPVKLKFIKGDEDNRVKLKSIR